MKIHHSKTRAAEHDRAASISWGRSVGTSFDDDLDRFNRDELAGALDECVLLLGRLQTLGAQTRLSHRHRRGLRRFCRRVATAVTAVNDELFDPSRTDR